MAKAITDATFEAETKEGLVLRVLSALCPSQPCSLKKMGRLLNK